MADSNQFPLDDLPYQFGRLAAGPLILCRAVVRMVRYVAYLVFAISTVGGFVQWANASDRGNPERFIYFHQWTFALLAIVIIHAAGNIERIARQLSSPKGT